jgi:O-antigen ligase
MSGSLAGREGGADRGLFYALLALLVWAPLPLGSNRPWAMAVLALWVFLLALLWTVGWARGRLALTAAFRGAKWPLLLLALWLVYGLVQVVPLPFWMVEVVSPPAAAIRTQSPLGAPGLVPLSLDVHASLTTWMLGLAGLLLFALALLLLRSRRRLRLLALVLLLSALFQAVLASVLALTEAGLWFIEGSSVAHGTFSNRNHLAGFLNMGLALGIGLLIADLSESGARATWRQRLRDWARTLLGPKARVRLYLAILVIALVMSHSRMGNLAFFFSLLIAGTIALVALRGSPRPVLILIVSLLVVDTLILGSWFGLERVRERLERTVLTEETRYHSNVQATEYLDDFWLTGSGGGTFAAVFPYYREEGLAPGFFTNAHNDYLELVLEFGVVGSLPLALVVLSSWMRALWIMRRRRDPLLRGLGFASLMGITAILIHSTADFNLRIPANAAIFVVLAALPWAMSPPVDRRHRSATSSLG